VASSNGRIIPLDYNTSAIDEMTNEHLNMLPSLESPDMTDTATEQLTSSGWTIAKTTGFVHLIGPFWQRVVDGVQQHALITEDKHHNRRGLVQGGLLMTFADRSCGMAARYVSGRQTLATVQLDVHFVDSGKIGEILFSVPRVIRTTRSLIFVTTEVIAGERCIATASGVFKILKDDA
jgi:acyl-coenzyme A thioesterase PaaI-like protein